MYEGNWYMATSWTVFTENGKFIQKVFLPPPVDAPKANKEKFYFNDLVDYDMFLRDGN